MNRQKKNLITLAYVLLSPTLSSSSDKGKAVQPCSCEKGEEVLEGKPLPLPLPLHPPTIDSHA